MIDRKRMAAWGALAVFLLAPAGCGGGGGERRARIPEDAIARVGDEYLTESDLENLIPFGARDGTSREERKAWIDRWVEMEVLRREAVRRGLDADPMVQARLESLEREFLADHLVFLELRERIEVTEAEIEDYFEDHSDEYVHEYRVSHILVNTREEAEEVRELLETRSFSWVADRYSVDPVARRGGDLGYLTKGNMIPAFETVIFDMEPGEVSDIVRSDFGFHIIRLVGVREAQVKVDLPEVRERLMNEMLMSRRESAYRRFMDSLVSAADIEYFRLPGESGGDPSRVVPGAPAEEDTSETREVDGEDQTG